MNSGFASFSRKLTLAVVVALALPASASAVTVTPTAATVTEGNSGTVDATFNVACEVGEVGPLSHAPAAGSAPAATPDADFEAASSGTLVPCPLLGVGGGGTVTVKVKGDALDEANEKFKLNVTLGMATVSSSDVTITDDDVPVARISPAAQVAEGDSGVSAGSIAVTLSQVSWQDIQIPFSTLDQSAKAGEDYTASSGTLTIAAGQTTANISPPIIGDTTHEEAEAFFVNLGDTDTAKVTLDNTKRQGVVVIFDNDPKPVGVFNLVSNQRVTEGNSGTVNVIFTVTLTPAMDQATQVAWKTANWTATLADYEGGQGILKFAPGETSKTISVNVKGDLKDEPDETFGVIIELPTIGTIGQAGALGIITDDDAPDGGGTPTPTGPGPKVTIFKPTRFGNRLSTLLTCPATATACNGTLVAKRGTLRVGKGKFQLLPGAETDLTFKISKKALKKLRKRGLKVRFTAVAKDTAGAEGTSTKRFKIKRIKPRTL